MINLSRSLDSGLQLPEDIGNMFTLGHFTPTTGVNISLCHGFFFHF